MQQSSPVWQLAKTKMSSIEMGDAVRRATKKLNSNDQMALQSEIRVLANSNMTNFGIASAHEVLARLGILFADNPLEFERLCRQRRKT